MEKARRNRDDHVLTEEKIREFYAYLQREEKQKATVEKYVRNIRFFAVWLDGRGITKETAAQWKEHLQEERYAPSTVNSKLAALNRFLNFAGIEECRVKFLHIQRRAFREDSRDLEREEYRRLLEAARLSGDERLELVIEAICATGIRVSELAYLTVEAAGKGRATVKLKGKIRMILLPKRLCQKLLAYARKRSILAGEIFLTRRGKGLSRRQIWREMKELSKKAGVESTKVFPHNLRHLFATVFYKSCGDIVKLADVLGHSSIETTRIYLMTSGKEHLRQIDRLCLV